MRIAKWTCEWNQCESEDEFQASMSVALQKPSPALDRNGLSIAFEIVYCLFLNCLLLLAEIAVAVCGSFYPLTEIDVTVCSSSRLRNG